MKRYMVKLSRFRDTTLEAIGPKEAAELVEDLGVELDLERSHLCTHASESRN